MSQKPKQLPIKEYDTVLEKLEKENFDLKLQISHLKTRLNELTNSSLTFIPACDCKKTKSETRDVLSEVKVEMKNLIEKNEDLKVQNTNLIDKLEEVSEENDSLRKDCIKLSQHISEKTRKEAENKNILQQMKSEIETVKEEMEQVERIKEQNRVLKEEYINLDRITKKLEEEYKNEHRHLSAENSNLQQQNMQIKNRIKQLEQQIEETSHRNHQLTNENHALSLDKQTLSQEARQLQTQLKMKTEEVQRAKELGERVVSEIKSKSRYTQSEKEELEKRAEKIIKERDLKIGQLKVFVNKLTTEIEDVNGRISVLQNGFAEYIKYIAGVTHRISKVSVEIERLKKISDSVITDHRADASRCEKTEKEIKRLRREKEILEEVVKDAKKEIEKSKTEKESLLMEREDLINRLHITPGTLKIAKDLGVKEFTTINNLFITWKNSQERLLQEIDRKHREEERERNEKLEDFQNKLHAALSELHFCRTYLEEKKSIIKLIKKQHGSSSLLSKIDVSNK